ncbi:UBC-like protein [Rhizopogon vinicolor AM-OR11-026]|uniref:Ubiquitin-conjugating enzyme E2 6 n=1 Tax=Rhizopogon vinicolor AM-OR11-026 TaxID=1314800 RepID=A0A1B7N4Q4_9AGAM|nr:UBC-like protein [Rhizopogon vinicolor AM-OR11-026]
MASKAAHKRLTKEYISMQREPPPFVWAIPDEKNILTWNYLIRGPPDSPFSGGEYHGVLIFPPEYPFKPPGIKMFTPSGRFQQDKKICFSMSDFHPGTWNPAWSVATILTGLLSFMLSDEMTTGSVTSSDGHKRAYAARSHSFNLSQSRFKEAFPDYCTETLRDLPNMGERERGKPDPPATQPAPITHTASLLSPPLSRSASATHQPQVRDRRPVAQALAATTTNASDVVNASLTSTNKPTTKPQGWTGPLRQVLWEKWRWGVLIAFAVIVSRLSSSP